MSINSAKYTGTRASRQPSAFARGEQKAKASQVPFLLGTLAAILLQILVSAIFVEFFLTNLWVSSLMLILGLGLIYLSVRKAKKRTSPQDKLKWDPGATLLLLANNLVVFGILMLYGQLFV